MLAALPRMTSATPDLTRAIDLVKKAVDPLLAQPFLAGNVVAGIAVTAATPIAVTHGLGRAWTGAEVVAFAGSAACQIRMTSTLKTDATVQIEIQPTATGTLSLRVF